MALIPTIKLPQGEQYWVLLRTDRDGASAEQVGDSVGDLFRWVLRNAQAAGTGITDLNQVFSTGKNEWRVGAARPIQLVSVGQQRPDYPVGKVIASRETYPGDGIPTVAGKAAWFVVVRFWWRASDTEVQWPSLIARVGSLTGFNLADYGVDQADWTLDRAIIPTTTTVDPGDATWGQVQAQHIGQAVGSLATGAKVVTGVVVLAAIAYLASKVAKR